MKLSPKIGNSTPPDSEKLHIMITLTKFQKFENFKLHETMWNASIIVNKLTYLLGAHVKPPKLAKRETFSKKLIFPKFRENGTISKNRKFYASWLGNVTYHDKQFIILRNYEFRTFLRNRVFPKNANTPTPWRNFRISKNSNYTKPCETCRLS
jgi:hypothetical protein